MTVANEKHTLTLSEMKELRTNGVKNVVGFDEGSVLLETDLGRLTVEGSDLKIESLSKENGEIVIVGNVSGIFYSGDKSNKGFFGKLFG